MNAPNRDNLVNILMVTFVAAAIWVWAAGETTETTNLLNQRLTIAPSPGDFTLVHPAVIQGVQIEFRGPARAVKAIKDEFPNLATVSVGSPGIDAQDGPQTIDLRTIIEDIVRQGDYPLSIASIQPETAEIMITLRTTQEADIIPRLAEGVRSTGTITVEPAVGSLILPTSLAGQGPIQLLAPITQEMLDDHIPGQRVVLTTAVTLPDALQSEASTIDIEPREVDVSIALLSAKIEHTLPSVPIQVAAPPAELDRFTVSITHGDGFLRDVMLRGPPATIQQIADGELSVVAFVHLTSDDLVKLVTERPISMWMLPPGVTVVKVGTATSTTPRVALEIVDRQAP